MLKQFSILVLLVSTLAAGQAVEGKQYPFMTLREVKIYNAQTPKPAATTVTIARKGQQVRVTTIALSRYNEFTGEPSTKVLYEYDQAQLTAERNRLLADAAEITQFLRDPK